MVDPVSCMVSLVWLASELCKEHKSKQESKQIPPRTIELEKVNQKINSIKDTMTYEQLEQILNENKELIGNGSHHGMMERIGWCKQMYGNTPQETYEKTIRPFLH